LQARRGSGRCGGEADVDIAAGSKATGSAARAPSAATSQETCRLAHGQLGAPPLMRPAGPDDRWRPDAGLRGEWALPRALATLQRWAAVGPRDLGRRVFSSRAAAARSRRRRRVTACAWSFSRLCRSRSPPGSPQVDQR
jgi:hypothetical protein